MKEGGMMKEYPIDLGKLYHVVYNSGAEKIGLCGTANLANIEGYQEEAKVLYLVATPIRSDGLWPIFGIFSETTALSTPNWRRIKSCKEISKSDLALYLAWRKSPLFDQLLKEA